MTLKQAFTIWAYSPGNTVLAAKSREAVQRVLMKKWNDIGLEQFTEQFCRRIFYQSTESLELKVKAASILVYVLQWGSDNGHCQRPTFTLAIAREEHERAEKDKAQQAEGIVLPTLAEMKGESVYMPADEPTVRVKPEALAKRKAELKARKSETKTEKNMDEKKTRGKQPKPVAQLDAKTLQVIKVWSSRSEAERELGACNLDRAINRKRMSAGFFWCSPEDAEGFQPNPLSKYAPKTQPKKQTNAEKQQAKVKNNFPTTVATLVPTPKPDDATDVTNDNQRGTAAHEALEVFTDDELMEELDRRGWQGELRKIQIVTIGTK
jgi:hypothetical protein